MVPSSGGPSAVAKNEPQRGALDPVALNLGGEPGGQMLGLGEGAPNLLGAMGEAAGELDPPPCRRFVQGVRIASMAGLSSDRVVRHLVEMGFELVQPGSPEVPVRLQPFIEGLEGLGRHAVEAALGVDPHADQTGVPEHPQVLGDRGWLTLSSLTSSPTGRSRSRRRSRMSRRLGSASTSRAITALYCLIVI